MKNWSGASLRRTVILAASLGGLLPAGCVVKQEAPPPAVAPEVAVFTVQSQQVVLDRELPGRTSPFLIAEIRPQVSGILEKRLFREGSNVKAGDVLYQIDPAPFQAVLDNARASLARSEANLPAIRSRVERYKDLVADHAVSVQDHDDAVAALNGAEADVLYWKAAVQSATINLDYTKVTAPISGRIGRSMITDGALVTAHQPVPLATIQQMDPIYVDVPQSTVDLLQLRARLKDGRLVGDGTNLEEVGLVLEDGTRYPSGLGTLQFQDVSVDPTTGSVILRAVFPNPDGILLPGMFVRAVVKEGANQGAILIPQQTVARDPKGNPSVLVVNAEGKVEQKKIVLDRAIGNKWLVASDLSPGDQIVAEGMMKIRPGASVKTVPFKAEKD
jgi:membrane fusion protein (multidrug efflux system)